MAKRYGRNQKRAHREQIRTQAVEIERLRVQAGELQKALGEETRKRISNDIRTQQFLDIIGNAVEYSAALPPKRVEGLLDDPETILCRSDKPLDRSCMIDDTVTAKKDYSTHAVHAFRLFVRKYHDPIRYAIHLRYGTGDESVYMASEEAFHSLPDETIIGQLLGHMRAERERLRRG